MIIHAQRASALLYRFVKTFPSGIYLLPANVCPIVPLTFVKAGVRFEFVDINPQTLCIDEMAVKALVKKNDEYCGVVFVRTYGYLHDTSLFFSELKALNPNFKIIDDKCLCFPDFRQIAPEVDMVLFSTGYAKPLDIGFGGYAIIHDEIHLNSFSEKYDEKALADLITSYKESLNRGELMENYSSNWLDTSNPEMKLDDYLHIIEDKLHGIRKHKKHLNDIYQTCLPKSILLPDDFQQWRFNIIVANQQLILDEIFKAGLFASTHYIPSSGLFGKDDYTVATNLSRQVINLFNDNYFTEDQALQLCEIIRTKL